MITDSMEEYLRTIQELSEEMPFVRAVDVARKMNYSKPSVHRAIGILRNEGYLLEENGKRIALSEKGKMAAEESRNKRSFFFTMLKDAGVSHETAEEEASRMSHAISLESFLKLEKSYGSE